MLTHQQHYTSSTQRLRKVSVLGSGRCLGNTCCFLKSEVLLALLYLHKSSILHEYTWATDLTSIKPLSLPACNVTFSESSTKFLIFSLDKFLTYPYQCALKYSYRQYVGKPSAGINCFSLRCFAETGAFC